MTATRDPHTHFQQSDKAPEVTSAIQDIYPLTGLQQGFLWHSLSDDVSRVGVEHAALVLRGPIRTDVYAQAWQRVADRHPMLRTAFAWEDLDLPLQIVYREVDLALEIRDLTHLGSAEQQERLNEYRADAHRRGFDLRQAPLARVALTRLDAETHWLDLSFHHLIMDGWSLALVAAEVHAIYDALCIGQAPLLGPAVPFRDYIAWLNDQDATEEEDFWRAKLDGLERPTLLQFDGVARKPVAEGVPSPTHQLIFSPAESAALRALARRDMVSLGTLMHGAWALLLSRYTGQHDVVFGSVVTGRPEELDGVTQMVGMFINNLPVRARVDPASRLSTWLRDLQGAQVEAQRFAHTSTSKLREWSGVSARVPLFDSLLVFQNFPVDEALAREHFGGLRLEGGIGGMNTVYPLTVTFGVGEQLAAGLGYDTRYFDADCISRLAEHFRTLLMAMSAQPDAPLGDLTPDLAAGERALRNPMDRQAMIAGVRINLVEVERILCEHSAVRACAVTAETRPNGDTQLTAYLVPEDAKQPDKHDLLRFLRRTLPDYMVPTTFQAVRDLPPLTGDLSDLLVLHEEPRGKPRDGIEARLADLWQRALGISQIDIYDSFFDLGGTSFIAGRLLDQIERAFGRRLPISVLLHSATIAHVADVLRGTELPSGGPVAIDVFNPGGSKPPLFCAHGPYEYVLYYRYFAQHLGPDQPMYVLRWDLTDNWDTRIRTLEELAARFVDAMRAIQPEGPYYLAGHSFGGWAAYEMAKQLHEAGQAVGLLALLDMGVRESYESPWARLVEKIHRTIYVLRRLAPAERLPQLRERFRRSLTPRQSDRAAGAAATRLSASYQLRPYPGRVTLFWATDVPRPHGGRPDARDGWAELAGGGVEVIPVPGDHVLILIEPRVHHLSEALRERLVTAQARRHAESRMALSGARRP